MTLNEFKAWFDGYTEDMDKPPTAKQWARIKKRVKEIDGQTITREVIYRNWPWWDRKDWVVERYASLSTGTPTISGNLSWNTSSALPALYDAGRHDAAADV